MAFARRQSGFTYLAALALVAVMGILLAATGIMWHTAQRREKERELLFAGDQFRKAIGLYYERTPGGLKQYPKSLDDLLKDARQPVTQRYLRKIYSDPITRGKNWGLVEAPGGGIMGVYSRSEEAPLKTAGFKLADKDFEGKSQYSDWKFVDIPRPAQPQKPATQQQSVIPPAAPSPSGSIPKQ